MVDEICSSSSQAKVANAGDIVSSLVTLGVSYKAEVIGVLMSSENLGKIFRPSVKTTVDYVSQASLGVIRALIKSSFAVGLSASLEEAEDPLLQEIINSLPHYSTILELPGDTTISTFNENVEVLGSHRLKITEIAVDLVKINNSNINAAIIQSELLHKLVGLLWRFEWNSLFHVQFGLLAQAILFGKCSDLQHSFLIASGFLQELVQRFKVNPRRAT